MILSLRKIYAMRIMDLLEKGKKANIGEVRDWKGKKYRKVQNGEWVIVREGHKDKGFHGEEHADVKQHLATHKDTEQSTVAGLRYVVSRDDKGHGHLKVIHNASGTVLAEGSVGGWGNASRVYAHLNHKLGGFDWKKSADALRKDIRENSSMREAVRHVLDNTEKWASNTHSKTLEGADKAEIKTTPKKYAAKKDEQQSSAPVKGEAQAPAAEKKPEVPKSEHKLTVGKTPDVAPSARYSREYQLHLQGLHDKIQAADEPSITELEAAGLTYQYQDGLKIIEVSKTHDGKAYPTDTASRHDRDELNHDLRKIGYIALSYENGKAIVEEGIAPKSEKHAEYEAARAAKPTDKKPEAPKSKTDVAAINKPAEKKGEEKKPADKSSGKAGGAALLDEIDEDIQARLDGGDRNPYAFEVEGNRLPDKKETTRHLQLAEALGISVPKEFNENYEKLESREARQAHHAAADELKAAIHKKITGRIEKLKAVRDAKLAKELAAKPEPTAKVEVKLSKKEDAERGLHNVKFDGKDLHKHAVTDTDNMKRVLHGVHHDTESGHIVSTDGKALVALKAEPKELEHINAAKKAAGFDTAKHAIIDAHGQAVEGKFPNWKQVLPQHDTKAVVDWKGEHAKLSEAFAGMKKKAQSIRQELIDEKAKGFADRKMAEKAVDRDLKHGGYAPSDTEEGKKIRKYLALSGKGSSYGHVPHVAYHTVSPEGKLEFHAVDLEKVKPSENGEIDNAAIAAHLKEKGITHRYNWNVLQQPLKIMATHRPHDTSGVWYGKGDGQQPHGFHTKGGSHMAVMPMKVRED